MASEEGPQPSRQLVFFSTGSLAGVCSATADFGFDRLASAVRGTAPRPVDALVRSMVPHIIKPGIRFWAFDLAKVALPRDMPVSLKGGLAGATGGFVEMALTNLHSGVMGRSDRSSPSLQTAVRTTLLHSGKLFLCFGSYTYLANTFSATLPPKPFPYCLLLGAIAGAFGTTVITPLEMFSAAKVPLSLPKVLQVALTRAPRGAVAVGTVIAVQVTSSAWILGDL